MLREREPERQETPQSDQNWLNPDVLQAARQVYRVYLRVHARQMRRPAGVIVNSLTHQSWLIFSSRPILLPGEQFIPVENIDSELS
ncbi:hypothetical protein M595_2255 [Lyngbya aestuarii BL J]|uniref:Uncharacterized protein n=1 Tax=Lyngbya aestuarii BL J TaxID=1348334 RepID=U7QIG7_9CYAN|nr:hypothetical protein [Lyngbya aestuarii]ERT07764.1 hypothetical protein M595_2255 [Lyngbya aestuarii BL J]